LGLGRRRAVGFVSLTSPLETRRFLSKDLVVLVQEYPSLQNRGVFDTEGCAVMLAIDNSLKISSWSYSIRTPSARTVSCFSNLSFHSPTDGGVGSRQSSTLASIVAGPKSCQQGSFPIIFAVYRKIQTQPSCRLGAECMRHHFASGHSKPSVFHFT
jgi:hypothetical protein